MTTLRAESPSTVLRATCPKEQMSRSAKNGFEGLEATKNTRPDWAVLDIQMPGMDGFEVAGVKFVPSDPIPPAVYQYKPRYCYYCASSRNPDRERLLNAGFQESLPEPFTPDKLLEAILTVLND